MKGPLIRSRDLFRFQLQLRLGYMRLKNTRLSIARDTFIDGSKHLLRFFNDAPMEAPAKFAVADLPCRD